MPIFKDKKSLQKVIHAYKSKGSKIGLVPTMGALHEAHLCLVREALNDNDWVVVSIFVNPTQFDKKEDLENYPQTLEQDVALLKEVSQDILVFAPSVEDMYEGNTVAEHFDFGGLEHEMEGKFRTGHFDGVGTIVKRLFEIVEPDVAYFGKKDYQQLRIIEKMVEKHQIPVLIKGCEIHREPNGLAMSSRNMRLTPDQREKASVIYKILNTAKEKFGTKSANKITEWVEKQLAKHAMFQLEYFTIADSETLKPIQRKSKNKHYRAFIAVYADKIRLIDNIALN